MKGNRLKAAFWNLQNLFEPGVSARGPQNAAQYSDRLVSLSQAIRAFFSPQLPDILGLCEVGSERVVQDLVHQLDADYQYLWQPAGSFGMTGLALVYRPQSISVLKLLAVYAPTISARPRSMVVEFELENLRDAKFVLCINHWKSKLSVPGAPGFDQQDRLDTAQWVTNQLGQRTPSHVGAIVMGDFNAEPFESVFSKTSLHSRRTFAPAFQNPGLLNHLYNPTWRFPAEEAWVDQAMSAGFRELRPKTTFNTGAAIYDQILISGNLLLGKPLGFDERNLRYFVGSKCGVHNRRGELRPNPWSITHDGLNIGISDHFPLLAEFNY